MINLLRLIEVSVSYSILVVSNAVPKTKEIAQTSVF